jgi:hypothetical protein
MNFLRKLLGRNKPENQEETQAEQYHCIRFMTERGEQLGMLLTHSEFQTAVQRWVENIDTMPIEVVDPNDETE